VSAMAVLLTLAAAVSWALTQVMMKLGVACMPRSQFGALRAVWGLAFVVPYGLATGGFVAQEPRLVLIALAGGALNGFAGTAMFYYAVTHSPVHLASSLANSGPLWGVLTAILILGEPPTAATLGAAVLVAVGTYLVVSRGASRDAQHRPLALLAALLAAALWGFTTAVPAKYCMSQGMSPIHYELLMVAATGVCWVAVAVPGVMRRGVRLSVRGVGLAAASAFTGFFLGWILWLTALQQAPASVLSPIMGTTALFAFGMGVLFLRERPTWRAAAGAALVFGGVVLVSTLG